MAADDNVASGKAQRWRGGAKGIAPAGIQQRAQAEDAGRGRRQRTQAEDAGREQQVADANGSSRQRQGIKKQRGD